eukprot:SAG31_NODE_913_length_11064_cov_4.529594_1_plen_90_part_00
MDAKPVVQVLEDRAKRDAGGGQATADCFSEKAAQSLSQPHRVANTEAQTAVEQQLATQPDADVRILVRRLRELQIVVGDVALPHVVVPM